MPRRTGTKTFYGKVKIDGKLYRDRLATKVSGDNRICYFLLFAIFCGNVN